MQPPNAPLALGPFVREYILPYNTLLAVSAMAAFVLGLASPVLVLFFGGLLLSLALLVFSLDQWSHARMYAWGTAPAASFRLLRVAARLLWAAPGVKARSAGLFWVLIITGVGVCMFGTKSYLDGTRENAPFSSRSKAESVPLLLVAPFKGIGDAPAQAVLLADGLTDEVIAGLGRFQTVRVLGRGTSAALKSSTADHVQLREKYGITHILSGELRPATASFSLKLELSETRTGAAIWSERLSGRLQEVSGLGDDVIRSVIGRAASELGRSNLRALAAAPKPDAYHLTLRARQLWQKPDRDSLASAQKLLEQAIELDPGYGPAYAYLSFTQLTSYNNSWSPGFGRKETLEKMLSLATQALELTPTNGTAHSAQAVAYAYLGRHGEASSSAAEAQRLNGSDADILGRVGQVQVFSGDHQKAIVTLKEAIALDPFGPTQWRNFLSRAYFFSGSYADAIRESRACLERANLEPCRETLAAAYASDGKLPEAAAVWKEIASKRPGILPEKLVERLRSAFARPEDLQLLVTGLNLARGP